MAILLSEGEEIDAQDYLPPVCDQTGEHYVEDEELSKLKAVVTDTFPRAGSMYRVLGVNWR